MTDPAAHDEQVADLSTSSARPARRRSALLGVAVVAVIAVVATGWVLLHRSSGDVTWHVVWSEDFAGSSLDPASWTAENDSTFGDGNAELACLTSRPENLTVSDGSLHLTARREDPRLQCNDHDSRFPGGRAYSSALVSTQGHHSWGSSQVEVRARLPLATGTSQGLWPAIWLRPEDLGVGEIDVMEGLGSAPGGTSTLHQTLHYAKDGRPANQSTTVALPAGFDPTAFHVYAVRSLPGRIEWLIDGAVTFSVDSDQVPDLDALLAKPYFLRLNLAVGGKWPGAPETSTTFPSVMDVDWVRVSQR